MPGPVLDLGALYTRYGTFVRRAATQLGGPDLDAEDLVQEVFFQAVRSSRSFAGRSSPKTWLYGITLGVVRNARRRARWRRVLGLDAAALVVSDEPGPDAQYEQFEVRQHLRRLIARLPDETHTVLVLFEFEGLRGEEIAELLECSVQSVWTRLHRARRRLAQEYEHEEREAPRPGGKPRKP